MRYAIAKHSANKNLDVLVLNEDGRYLVATIAKSGEPTSMRVLLSTAIRGAAQRAALELVQQLRSKRISITCHCPAYTFPHLQGTGDCKADGVHPICLECGKHCLEGKPGLSTCCEEAMLLPPNYRPKEAT